MKNTLGDLNNHLFAQLERLGDEDLSKENLEKELFGSEQDVFYDEKRRKIGSKRKTFLVQYEL